MTINQLKSALDNLALAASNDTSVLQQLTPANLALSWLVTMLTAVNKKLAEAFAKVKLAMAMPGTPGEVHTNNVPFPGNYCWTPHGHWVSQNLTSATCGNKATGHRDETTTASMMGGNNANKG